MLLLVDGHNLIPKIPGLSLSDPEDETKLLRLLQEYCRLRRQKMECFFDHAPEGRPRAWTYGTISVKFARLDGTAEDEINKRLSSLGNNARNATVVSSDQGVQMAARAARSEVKSSEAFAQELIEVLRRAGSQGKGPGEAGMVSPEEVEMWLKVFKKGKKD